ncbi:MAG: hypothetical protein C4518_02300 [Desulfobacteraceae bacterium]|nr:MAG: hypothetical protein C4518_02300 [Desulfobacteraceae bacterium]
MGKGGIENRVQQMKDNVSPFNADFRIGGFYDSRVGSSSGTGDDESSTGMATTLNAGWQAPMEGNMGLRMDYSGYADFHQVDGKNLDQYDVIDQSVSLEPQYNNGPFVYSLPTTFNYAMEAGKRDYQRYSLAPTVTYLIPETSQAVALYGIGALIDDRDDVNTDEDGESLGGGCAYLYFFQNKSRVRLSLDYQHTDYDARLSEYDMNPLHTDKRSDNMVVAGLDMVYQFTTHVGLYTNYSFIHANSNIDQYEYDRHVVEGGVALKY